MDKRSVFNRIMERSAKLRLMFGYTHPELLEEWHPMLNDISPYEISQGSHKIVWWRCKLDSKHEWESAVRIRVKGSKCPYCSGKKASLDYCLASLQPELAKEWHPTKNGDLTPYDITLGSSKKVWWQCSKNPSHQWQSVVQNRVTNSKCQYCTKKRASKEYCLMVQNPELGKQWHRNLNGNLTPNDVTPKSKRKVWWTCNTNPNHEWQATICNRSNGSNCPDCNNSLQTSFPELAIYYYFSILFSGTKSRYSLNGMEIDIYVPELKLAIEYDGWYFHKDFVTRDIKKNQKIKSQGLTFIRIREQPLPDINDYDVLNIFALRNNDKELDRVIKELFVFIKDHFSLDTFTSNLLSQIDVNVNEDRIKILNQIELVKRENSLSFRYPTLAKEWHPIFNGNLQPEHVSAGSNISVWWQCSNENSHVWRANVGNRSRGDSCPYCSNKKVCIDNCLATTDPALAKEWHPTKNKSLSPYDITSGSHKRIWWLCQENENHSWIATPKTRLRSQTLSCPFCIGKRASMDNCLATINPELSSEWHLNLNGKLTSYDITPGSSKSVWWKCKTNENHTWKASVSNRNRGDGCPYCSGRSVSLDNCIATLRPDLANEWHPTLNGDLTPYDVTIGSNETAWWQCSNNRAHKWNIRIANRGSLGTGCPFCVGKMVSNDNCLATIRPDLIQEWHPTLNGHLTPYNVTHGSKKKVWWQCKVNTEHKWCATPNNRISLSSKCPYCSGKKASKDNCLATKRPDIAKDWHPTLNINLSPDDVTLGSNKLVWWQCDKISDHLWAESVNKRVSKKTVCPMCKIRKKNRFLK